MRNIHFFKPQNILDFVPEDKIWRDQKFVGCADAI
jgi:hypothetical protein